ncbi:MAG: T9SS type A sorting domain-containing protein [bacterium]|nr:T9SS type A sorting domain-containing protein [bacterium]
MNNSSVSGVWVNLTELNGVGTLSIDHGFTDALGQVHVCITQPVSNSYQDVRLQVCSEGLWPKKLSPCPGTNSQVQVMVNATPCEICRIVELPGDNWLPVELTSFTAVPIYNGIEITWATASESDVARFELVRDGLVIEQFQAANSAAGAHYTHFDGNVENGHDYTYELVCVSLAGARDVMATAAATPQIENSVVSTFALHQNYPNPFNPETTISFELADAANVTLAVFNVSGQKVASLVNGNLGAGQYTVSFDGAALTSGVYLYRLTAGTFTAQKKMVLLK